jgi:hypothetical protein
MLMDEAIQSVSNNPAIVQKVKISPFLQRWWMPELSLLWMKHCNLQLRSYKKCHIPNNPVQDKVWKVESKYKEKILHEKKQHWEVFLANMHNWNSQIWTANKIILGTGSDSGRTPLPPLCKQQGADVQFTRTDEEKAQTLNTELFLPPPPPPAEDPDDAEQALEPALFPPAVEDMGKITAEQIQHTIKKFNPWKAVMAGNIPNAVLQ